jgi:hypothetical protein
VSIIKKYIKLDIFGIEFPVYLIDTADDLERIYKKRDLEGPIGNILSFEGLTVNSRKGDLFVVFKKSGCDTGVIAHECCHVSWVISEFIGLNFKEDEEVQCYMIQHLHNQIEKFIKDKGVLR